MTKTAAIEVMYVDDSEDDQILATMALEATGRTHELRIADSAIEIWAVLGMRIAQGQPLPSLLVIDLRMPMVDGHQLMRQLADDDDMCQIPVAVLSTSSDPSDVELARQSGACAYEVKPSRFTELVDTFNRVLDLAESPN